MFEFTAILPKDLEIPAKSILSQYKAPFVVALCGELGSGKTAFVGQFAKELGITSPISSPTFIIHSEYPVPETESILHHIDLYRINDVNELKELKLEEISDSQNIIVVEWADKFTSEIKSIFNNIPIVWLNFEHISETSRRITSNDL